MDANANQGTGLSHPYLISFVHGLQAAAFHLLELGATSIGGDIVARRLLVLRRVSNSIFETAE